MSNIKTVTLRCNDGGEACVLKKITFEITNDFNPVWFEFAVEDDYVGGDYKGFFGRLKRAWKGFIGKPVVYTSIYCENKEHIQKFLEDCLALVKEDEEDFETKYKPQPVSDEMIKKAFDLIREVNERERRNFNDRC